MQAITLDTKEAANKRWAAADARQRSLNNASHYKEAEKIRAERMKLALELCYTAKGFYIAYGKKSITVKIDNATVADRRSLALLEQDYTKQGVTKKVSAQGVMYCIPKA